MRADIDAVPDATAVTRPSADTEATSGASDPHSMLRSGSAIPLASLPTAESCAVWPTMSDCAGVVIVTVATRAGPSGAAVPSVHPASAPSSAIQRMTERGRRRGSTSACVRDRLALVVNDDDPGDAGCLELRLDRPAVTDDDDRHPVGVEVALPGGDRVLDRHGLDAARDSRVIVEREPVGENRRDAGRHLRHGLERPRQA